MEDFVERLRNAYSGLFDKITGQENIEHVPMSINYNDQPVEHEDMFNNWEAAENSMLYVPSQVKFWGKISPRSYDDFSNNREAFDSMMREWANEDNYEKRQNIIKRYVDAYGFNNEIHQDMLNQIVGNDSYYNENPYDPFKEEGQDQILPYNPFNIRDNRSQWLDWAYGNQDFASNRYNPYRRA